jgi:hypothetical protein
MEFLPCGHGRCRATQSGAENSELKNIRRMTRYKKKKAGHKSAGLFFVHENDA